MMAHGRHRAQKTYYIPVNPVAFLCFFGLFGMKCWYGLSLLNKYLLVLIQLVSNLHKRVFFKIVFCPLQCSSKLFSTLSLHQRTCKLPVLE